MKVNRVSGRVLSGPFEPVYVYEAPVRFWHWAMMLCMIVLAGTGYLIGNPLPAIGGEATFSYIFGNIRMIHFIAAMLFAVLFLVRVVWVFVGNHHPRSLFVPPVWSGKWWSGLFSQLAYYLFLRKEPHHWVGHNPLAQLATFAMFVLGAIVFGISRYLDDLGYEVIPYSPYLPVEMGMESKGLIGDISHRHTDYEAGLGTFGKSRLLLTERFGPRVRFLSIITNAPLKSGKPLKKDFCNNCALCIKACPVGAIDQNGNVDVMKCAKENMKLGLPGVTQFFKRWIPASEDEKKTMLKSPTFWEIWPNVTTGIFYYCFECLNACPVGKRREKGKD